MPLPIFSEEMQNAAVKTINAYRNLMKHRNYTAWWNYGSSANCHLCHAAREEGRTHPEYLERAGAIICELCPLAYDEHGEFHYSGCDDGNTMQGLLRAIQIINTQDAVIAAAKKRHEYLVRVLDRNMPSWRGDCIETPPVSNDKEETVPPP